MNKRLVKPLRSQPIRYAEGAPNPPQPSIKRKLVGLIDVSRGTIDGYWMSGMATTPRRLGNRMIAQSGSWEWPLRSIPIKAGEVVSGMFPSRRTYPRIPSPNGVKPNPFAVVPQRKAEKGWLVQGGKRVYVPLPSDFGASGNLRDAAGRSVVVPKQVTPALTRPDGRPAGLRPRPIDQTKRTGVPSRASVGQEATQEFASNPSALLPSAMRDPDPWRVAKVQPRGPSPLAKVSTNIRDMSLRMDPKFGTSRGLRPDDTSISMRGQSAALGETQRTESPAAARTVDPAKYRKGTVQRA